MSTETGYADAGTETLEEAAALDVESLRLAARAIARAEVSDAVSAALNDYDGSLRELQDASGLDPAFVSRLARGLNKQGATVASLAQIALAMNKSLKITIE
jgi:hypothetical protein